MAVDVYREIPSVLISTALGLRPRAVLISTSGIFPVYRLKPCVNLYIAARQLRSPLTTGSGLGTGIIPDLIGLEVNRAFVHKQPDNKSYSSFCQ